MGVRLSASPVGYIGWLMLLESLCVPMFALVRCRDVLLKQPRRILLAGLAAGAHWYPGCCPVRSVQI